MTDMPNLGMSADPSGIRSHTGTQQWQSFEIRMRHRRADRCLLRAEAALDAGFEEEARVALQEARALKSDVPTFEDLLAAAHARRAILDRADRRQRWKRRSLGVAALAFFGLAGAWAVVPRDGTPAAHAALPQAAASAAAPVATPPPTAPPLTTAAASPPAPATNALAPATPPPSVPAAKPPVAPPAFNRAARPSPILERGPATGSAATAPIAPVQPRPEEPGRIEPPTPSPPPVPTTGDMVASQPLPSGPAGLDGVGMAIAAPPAPVVSAPEPKPAPSAAEPASAEPAVRSVLAKFEAAYSALNASAAQQVWPSVDARSLARAFDGLESQRVSLGSCAITVVSVTARAECTGSTTWTPKVGGGARTEWRRWRFDLARTGSDWRIVGAEAR